MNEQQKAEAYVRSQLPELMELSRNCVYRRKSYHGSWFTHVLDHPTSYEHLCGCTRGTLTTCAFTSFRCGLCRKEKSWPNGAPPKWCVECAEKRSVCPHCKTKLEIIGHPIQLQHWLRVLDMNTTSVLSCYLSNDEFSYLRVFPYGGTADGNITFNLTTGQPATEADYQKFNEIVGI